MKLISYLKQIWENKSLILEGLKNVFFSTGWKREIAIERLEICRTCPYNSKNVKEHNKYFKPLDFIEEKAHLYPVPFKHCTLCGCSLLIKTFSMEAECPKKFWLSENI